MSQTFIKTTLFTPQQFESINQILLFPVLLMLFEQIEDTFDDITQTVNIIAKALLNVLPVSIDTKALEYGFTSDVTGMTETDIEHKSVSLFNSASHVFNAFVVMIKR